MTSKMPMNSTFMKSFGEIASEEWCYKSSYPRTLAIFAFNEDAIGMLQKPQLSIFR
jgi:hypothetical protein